jgi:hypothetical protein
MSDQQELPFGVEPETFWSSRAEMAVRTMARMQVDFQAFDLVEAFGLGEPSDQHQWGALFTRLRKAGVIKPVGYAQSKRPTVAGSACRVWRGTPDAARGAA